MLSTGYLNSEHPLVIATSGGPDSTALLNILYSSPSVDAEKLVIAHLNHDFRGQEAEDDAKFVENIGKQLGITCVIGKADPLTYQNEKKISSFEQAAREMRYSFLRDVAKEHDASAVILGHTLDDLAETIMGHILRGTGLQGLIGMELCGKWPFPYGESDLIVIRPMLEISKAETEYYCLESGIDFRRDTGNYSHRFTRNRLRHSLFPDLESNYNPKVKESLVRLSKVVSENLKFIDDALEGFWGTVTAAETSGSHVKFNIEQYLLAPLNIRRLLLRKAYEHIVGNTTKLQENHVDLVVNQLVTEGKYFKKYQIADWPNGIKVFCNLGFLEMSVSDGMNQTVAITPVMIDLSMLNNPSEHYYQESKYKFEILNYTGQPIDFSDHNRVNLDADKLPNKLLIRIMNDSDRFQPYGFPHEIRIVDYFSKRQVSKAAREIVPIIVDESGFVWAVGNRINQMGAIDRSTKRLLIISKVLE